MPGSKLVRRVTSNNGPIKTPCFCYLLGGCCSLLLLINLALVILVGSFKLPSAQLVNTESGQPPYQVVGGNFNNGAISGDLSTANLLMNWILSLKVENDNFYGFKIDRLTIKVYYTPANLLISTADNVNINIARNGDTLQKIPITMILKLSGDQLTSYKDIMSKCGAFEEKRSKLPLRYEITVDTVPLNWIMTPTIKINLDTRTLYSFSMSS